MLIKGSVPVVIDVVICVIWPAGPAPPKRGEPDADGEPDGGGEPGLEGEPESEAVLAPPFVPLPSVLALLRLVGPVDEAVSRLPPGLVAVPAVSPELFAVDCPWLLPEP